MRYLTMIFVLLAVSPVLFAAETSVGLNSCVILNDSGDETAESLVAMQFAIPEAVSDKEIIYAELTFSFALQTQHEGALCDFIVYPATNAWSEETIDYEDAVSLLDDKIAGSYTVRFDESNEFNIDITEFVAGVIAEERFNYGLIAITDFLGDNNIQLSTALGNTIKNDASVKIVYK